jgi:hypothetical protein
VVPGRATSALLPVSTRPPAWRDVSITLDTYSHAIPAMQEVAAALIAGLVFSGK